MKIEVTKVEQPDISVRLGDRVVKLTESETELLCSELCRILNRAPNIKLVYVYVDRSQTVNPYPNVPYYPTSMPQTWCGQGLGSMGLGNLI